jgi:hypothetical protein
MSIVLPTDELAIKLVEAGVEQQLADDTAAHSDGLEADVQTLAKELKEARTPPDPKIVCPECKGHDVIKEVPVTVHAALNVTSLTKSSLRLPGIDIPIINWDRATLLCKACGWSNKPKKGWLAKLLG